MKYQLIAQYSIKLGTILLALLFAWSSYHTVMSTTHFDKMQIPCTVLCITATQLPWNDVLQGLYVSAVVISAAMLFYLFFGSWTRGRLLYQWLSDVMLFLHEKVFLYVQKQQPHFRLFCPIIEQYQQGIVAPKLCD